MIDIILCGPLPGGRITRYIPPVCSPVCPVSTVYSKKENHLSSNLDETLPTSGITGRSFWGHRSKVKVTGGEKGRAAYCVGHIIVIVLVGVAGEGQVVNILHATIRYSNESNWLWMFEGLKYASSFVTTGRDRCSLLVLPSVQRFPTKR